jgi:hypothetical protein
VVTSVCCFHVWRKSVGKWISKLNIPQKRRTKCSYMVSAHGQSAIVVTALSDKMGLMYTCIVLLLLGGFRSQVVYVTDKECNTTSYTISIFVLTILTVIAQSSLLQSINRCLKFVPQFVILVAAGYVTFISYCNITNVLFQNSLCTKVVMKAVQLQSS